MTETVCRICGTPYTGAPFEVREMMRGEGSAFPYFQCPDCGCLQIVAPPADLARYYGADYYSFGSEWIGVYGNPVKRWIARQRNLYAITGAGLTGRILYRFWPRIPLTCLRRIDLRPDSRILDVGCGTGSMLMALKEAGFDHVHGIDPFIEKEIRYPNGLIIEKKPIEAATDAWDLVMFNHSLEHIQDQQGTLALAAGLLVPGGMCMVRIPTVSSYAWEHYGADWAQLDAPRHLYLHSRESLARAARQAGLRVIDQLYDSSSFQFWGSEQYRRDVALTSPNSFQVNPRASLFSRRDISRFSKEAKRLNASGRGDQAAFYLIKEGSSAQMVRR